MNSWSNAIILSIVLVAGVWLLVVHAGKPVKPEPLPPGPPPVERPVESDILDAESRSLIRDARGAIAVIGRSPEATAILSKAFADISALLRVARSEVRAEQPVAEWQPPAGQVVLFFHPDAYQYAYAKQYVSGMEHGSRLIQEGHVVYATARPDIRRQFRVTDAPTWLVLRDGREIYRDARAPVFRRPVQQAPMYSQPAYRTYSGPTCASGVCR